MPKKEGPCARERGGDQLGAQSECHVNVWYKYSKRAPRRALFAGRSDNRRAEAAPHYSIVVAAGRVHARRTAQAAAVPASGERGLTTPAVAATPAEISITRRHTPSDGAAWVEATAAAPRGR